VITRSSPLLRQQRREGRNETSSRHRARLRGKPDGALLDCWQSGAQEC